MSNATPELPVIVVVDDDVDHLFLTRRMLEKAEIKFQIVELHGGEQAIAYLSAGGETNSGLQSQLPAVVILDLHMPGIDGFAFLRWAQKRPELHGLKVIILSCSEDPKDAKEAALLGAAAFIVKYPSAIRLSRIVRQILQSEVDGGTDASPHPVPNR